MVKFAQLPKYEAYKDSGVEWLGEIPTGWRLSKFKYLANIKKGKLPRLIVSEVEDDNYPPYLSMEYLRGGIANQFVKDKSASVVNENQILLLWDGSNAGEFIKSRRGVVSSTVAKINFHSVNQEFAWYACHTTERLLRCSTIGMGIPHVDGDELKNSSFPLPTNFEQTLIANFLDQKTAQIDAAIAIKEQQIELLKERKQIIIQQAVTQGLDPNVPMKDSGVEWIGQIPEHWEVKKIKHLAKIFRGKFTHRPRNDPAFYDGNYPFFQTGDVARAGKFLSDYKQTLNEKGLKVSTLIPRGTVVITIAANIGDVSILDIDACFPDSVVGFQPNNGLNRDYLYYALSNMKQQFIDSSIKNTQMNLNVDRIGTNYICEPPENEQLKIVTLIEEQDHEINRALDLQKQQIHKLKEYKTTLINSAVTGKIKITPELLAK